VEYLGRIDHQVKVRGQRIEPGEAEHALETHPAVERAVVAPVTVEGLTELHGYVLAREKSPPRNCGAIFATAYPKRWSPPAFSG